MVYDIESRSKFKVGDRVRIVKKCGDIWVPGMERYIGHEGVIYYITPKGNIEIDSSSYIFPPESLDLVESEYTFSISHPEQIDWERVQEDLSWGKPLAVLKVRGEDDKYYVVVHQLIYSKIYNVSRSLRKYFHKHVPSFTDPITLKELERIKYIVKKVKNHKWVGGKREVLDVEVCEI